MYKYFKRNDLRLILDTRAAQFEAKSGKPDKTIDSFYNEEGNCLLINQCRIYQKAERLMIITEHKLHIIPFSKIIGYKVVNLNQGKTPLYSATTSITKTDNGDMIKRAIIGGVVAGGVGAVIGGATAKRKTTKSSSTAEEYANMMSRYMASLPDMELTINIDDVISPSIKIAFDQCKKSVEKIADTLNVIVRRNAESVETVDSKVESIKSGFYSTSQKLGLIPTDEYGQTAKMVKEQEEREQEQIARQKKQGKIAFFILAIIGIMVLIAIISLH